MTLKERDSGANIVKEMNLDCFGHTLQLFVNDGLQAQRVVTGAVAKTRKIATHFE